MICMSWHVFFSQQRHRMLKRIIIPACNIFTKTPNPSSTTEQASYPQSNRLRKPESLPDGIHLELLKKLNLWGCSKLKRLPEFSSAGNIEEI